MEKIMLTLESQPSVPVTLKNNLTNLIGEKKLKEKMQLKGALDASKTIMEFIEKDSTLTRDDILASLHIYHMELNNSLFHDHQEGSLISGVEHYTNKYLTSNKLQWDLENPYLLQ